MTSFNYISPTDEQKNTMQVFRDKYQALYNEVAALDKSRGLSLALTNLEQSAMWLNKAITKND